LLLILRADIEYSSTWSSEDLENGYFDIARIRTRNHIHNEYQGDESGWVYVMSAAKSIDRGARILQWERNRGVCMARRSLEFSSVVSREGRWYVAHCPEVEITSQGKSVELALENLREAIELYPPR